MAMRMQDLAHGIFYERLRLFLIFSLSLFLTSFQLNPSHAASPSAPQYVEAMADSTQAAITWEAPSSNGGESALTYTARVWSLPPPTASPAVATCTTTQFGCIVTGLTSGTPYYVDVIASNSSGAGAPSAVRSMTPGGAGKAPTNVSATSDSKGLVTIKWTPITNAGTGVFSWYTAEVFTSPEISIGAYSGYCTESNIAGSSCFIGGLKLGATYYAQVRIYSSLGSGFPSTPRFSVVAGASAAPSATPTPSPSTPSSTSGGSPKATPGATGLAIGSDPPQQVKVVSLSKALRISWSPPKRTGGLKILGYRVEAIGGGTDALMRECRTSAKVFTCTLKNLGSKQVYNLAVFVVFAGKESPSSKIFRVLTKS
jgi:hypothetical protein